MKWSTRRNEFEELDKDDVHITWVDFLLNTIIAGGVIFLLFMMCKFASNASEPVTIPVAGVTRHLMQVQTVAEVRANRMRKEEEAEKERQRQLKAQYKIIFGYVPSNDEILLIKHVAMHEAGNTEPHEGIVALIACVANRARLRDGRFPNTVIGVGYQDGQMTCVTDGSIWSYTVNNRVEAAWQDFISGGYTRHPKIVSWTAGHYNPYFEPAYPIGNHFFGY